VQPEHQSVQPEHQSAQPEHQSAQMDHRSAQMEHQSDQPPAQPEHQSTETWKTPASSIAEIPGNTPLSSNNIYKQIMDEPIEDHLNG